MEEDYDTDKRFNLQIIIQKLQEELAIFRNGTDVPQLLELLREKDDEINTLREVEAKYSSLLHERAKLMSKHENLLDDMQQVKSEKIIALSKCSMLEETVEQQQDVIQSLENNISRMNLEYERKQDALADAEANVRTLDSTVYELQNKCARLVKEKCEATKQLEREKEERSRQILEYRVRIISL